jgi:hypothetical protein
VCAELLNLLVSKNGNFFVNGDATCDGRVSSPSELWALIHKKKKKGEKTKKQEDGEVGESDNSICREQKMGVVSSIARQ